MRIPRQHRLDAVANDLGQVGVVDAGGAEAGDVGVAALAGAYVQARGLLGWFPEVAVEVALSPIRRDPSTDYCFVLRICATRVKCRPVSLAMSRIERPATRAYSKLLANLLVSLLGALEIGLRLASCLACFGLRRVCHALDLFGPAK
jgi:hypothetical protein